MDFKRFDIKTGIVFNPSQRHNYNVQEPEAFTHVMKLKVGQCMDMLASDWHKAFSAIKHRKESTGQLAAQFRIEGKHLRKFTSRGLGELNGVKCVRVFRTL